jgi:5'(3')-deoxyribonucleotidase
MKRKTILVDLDNVVYDWARAMAQWLAHNGALHGYAPAEAMKQYVTWEVWNDWKISKGEFTRWWRLGIEAGEIYGKGPLIAGARDSLWRLSDNEWDIQIVTSRLTKFGLHDTIIENTASWLRNNNIPYRGCLFTNHKTDICADAIVDDRADNMIVDEAGPHLAGFVFPANHNKGRVVTVTEQREAWFDIVQTLC